MGRPPSVGTEHDAWDGVTLWAILLRTIIGLCGEMRLDRSHKWRLGSRDASKVDAVCDVVKHILSTRRSWLNVVVDEIATLRPIVPHLPRDMDMMDLYTTWITPFVLQLSTRYPCWRREWARDQPIIQNFAEELCT